MSVSEELHGSVRKIKFTRTSAADGTASEITTWAYSGKIIGAVFIPGSGADQPDNLYDVLINDQESIDVLAGEGADKSNASTEQSNGAMGTVANDRLTLAISNAGDAKSGVVIIYIR